MEKKQKICQLLYQNFCSLQKITKQDEHKKFNISEIIESIINNFKIIYPNQKINFTSKKIMIISDCDLIKQLLVNLIENGIKYGKGNDIDIDIIKNQNVTIKIKDRGEGISKKTLLIFMINFSSGQSQKQKYGKQRLRPFICKKNYGNLKHRC